MTTSAYQELSRHWSRLHRFEHLSAMAGWDRRFCNDENQALPDRDAVEAAFVGYMATLATRGEPWGHASRHMMGLRNGLPGARRWRQVWSDPKLKAGSPQVAHALASRALADAAAAQAAARVETAP